MSVAPEAPAAAPVPPPVRTLPQLGPAIWQQWLVERIPYNAFLGVVIETMDEGRVMARLPHAERLCAADGAIDDGVLAALLDAICGIAPMTTFRERRRVATLDLRVDHLRRPAAGVALRCIATLIRLDEQIATVRGVIVDREGEDGGGGGGVVGDGGEGLGPHNDRNRATAGPVALATAAFAIFAPVATATGRKP